MVLAAVNDDQAPSPAFWARAGALPPGAPVVVMIHGYRFSPHSPAHSPHRHILSLTPDAGGRRALSWPAALGFTKAGDEGLAVAFGWEARGGLRQAYRNAASAGAGLAPLIDRLAVETRRPVQLIGHSLGARVALAALRRAAPGAVGRVVTLAAAELRPAAEAAIASPAGMLAEVVNVTSRENDPYDLALELIVGRGWRRALGFGLDQARPNWLDLPIDAPETLAALGRMGFPVGGRTSRACHWSPYLREGLFAVWRALLCRPDSLTLPALARALPGQPARRWSQLLRLPAAQPRGGAESSLSTA